MRLWFLALVILAACGGRGEFGKVDGGAVSLEGQVDADYFVRQLDQLDPWFEACYARALRRDRETEGVITLRLRGGGGRLQPSIAHNETGSEDLAECVMNAVSNVEIVEREGDEPWNFAAEWPVTFSILRRN